MKKVMLAVAVVSSLAAAGCTTAEQTAVGGAAVGAAVGGLASGRVEGALAGAAIGGATGYIIGRAVDNRPGWCQDVDSRTGRVVSEPYRC